MILIIYSIDFTPVSVGSSFLFINCKPLIPPWGYTEWNNSIYYIYIYKWKKNETVRDKKFILL